MSGKKKKLDIKTILTIAVVAIVLIGLFTGKISLADLGLGSGASTSQEGGLTVNTETQAPATTKAAQTTAKAAESTTKAADATTKAAQSTTKAAETAKAETKTAYKEYHFRSSKLLNEHFEKHGKPEMGFKTAAAYEKAASDVINNPNALHKTEKEDGDFCYYVEKTNEFVVLSKDGYIRTYFKPSAGISYYNRQ